MADLKTLLVEIGTEELPPKSLNALASALHESISRQLDELSLPHDSKDSRYFAAPRRMAVRIAGLPAHQADRSETRLGPAVQAAFDADGNPTPAAAGFARSVGVEVSDLERVETDKGERLGIVRNIPGQATDSFIESIIDKALQSLPVPKAMRWGDREDSFVRPVHWIVALLDDQPIEGELFGIEFGTSSMGHRFHHPAPVALTHADQYPDVLLPAHVMADQHQRRDTVRQQADEVAASVGAVAHVEDALLDEVTALVEWPSVVCGSFDSEFLDVPHQALISSMQNHQKFFPLLDQNGRLVARFLATANLESSNEASVIDGLERVIRPRLADARFFWQQDQKQPLDALIPALDSVVYQKDLGSLGDKIRRVSRLGLELAGPAGLNSDHHERAAQLYKCDLLSDMVGEFPELQGIMGEHYARIQGEAAEVASALSGHYQPKTASDDLPSGDTAVLLALSERLDTLCGIFAAGLKPTGNRDPFALRRAANGIVRLLIELELKLDLATCVDQALCGISQHIETATDQRDDIIEFVIERLRSYYLAQGFSQEQFNSVWARHITTLTDFDARIRACRSFTESQAETAQSLAVANKRIGNILRKSGMDSDAEIEPVDTSLLTEGSESTLYTDLADRISQTAPLLGNAAYQDVLNTLSSLRQPIDSFFDDVMVMVDDESLKQNRLRLLATIKQQFDAVADISLLDTESA